MQIGLATAFAAMTADRLAAKPGPSAAPAVAAAPATADESYCSNIADAAADARLAWQTGMLQDLETKIDAKIAELDAKRSEYQDWLKQRDAEMKKAEMGIVGIYAKMRPDAAAIQLATLDIETAVSILHQLGTRNASASLNEMETARAAQLMQAMANAPRQGKDGRGS